MQQRKKYYVNLFDYKKHLYILLYFIEKFDILRYNILE